MQLIIKCPRNSKNCLKIEAGLEFLRIIDPNNISTVFTHILHTPKNKQTNKNKNIPWPINIVMPFWLSGIIYYKMHNAIFQEGDDDFEIAHKTSRVRRYSMPLKQNSWYQNSLMVINWNELMRFCLFVQFSLGNNYLFLFAPCLHK